MNERQITRVLAIVFCLTAALSVGRVITKGSAKGLDFHLLLWYPGHFVWEGAEPYTSSLERREPRLPVRYWDGPEVTTGSVAQFDLRGMPTNTAPVLLGASLLARLSWPHALGIWTAIVIALALTVLWLTVHLVGSRLWSVQTVLLAGLYFSLIATREVVELGQTTTLIFAGMLAALALAKDHEFWAGIVLGFALSKYSLAFPAVLVLLWMRRWRALIPGVAVQAAGVVVIAAIAKTSPWVVLGAYYRIMVLHANMEGIQLTAGLLRGAGFWATVSLVLGSAVWFAFMIRCLLRIHKAGWLPDRFAAFNLLTALVLWDLLVFYHRRYDYMAGIFFLALILFAVVPSGSRYALSSRERRLLMALAGLLCLLWIPPTYALIGQTLYRDAFNLCGLLALFASTWLLSRMRWQRAQEEHSLALEGRVRQPQTI